MATSTKARLKVGDRYMVRFWDHCISDKQELVMCRLYGWVVSFNKDRLTVSTWEVETDDKEMRDGNVEMVNIIRSTVVEIRKIDSE